MSPAREHSQQPRVDLLIHQGHEGCSQHGLPELRLDAPEQAGRALGPHDLEQIPGEGGRPLGAARGKGRRAGCPQTALQQLEGIGRQRRHALGSRTGQE